MSKKNGFILAVLLGLALVLAACGDPTATPRPVGVAVPPVTTAAVTTAAPTSQPANPAPTAKPDPSATPRSTATAVPTATPAPTATVLPENKTVVRAKKGEKVVASEGFSLLVKSTEYGKQFTKMVSSRPGNTLIAVEIELQNLVEKPYTFGTGQMVLRDADNRIYNYAVYGKFPALHDVLTTLAKNQSRVGSLTYEVPQTASGLLLEYNPVAKDSEIIQIELD
jgi:hypothetical protein